MEKKDLYLGDEARGAIRDRIKYGEPYHNIKYGDGYPNASREELICNAVAVASADYAVKKVIELMEGKGVYFRSADKLCINNWEALKKLIET